MNSIIRYNETRKELIKLIEARILPLITGFDFFGEVIIECLGEPYVIDSITSIKDNSVVIQTKNGAHIGVEYLSLNDLRKIYSVVKIKPEKEGFLIVNEQAYMGCDAFGGESYQAMKIVKGEEMKSVQFWDEENRDSGRFKNFIVINTDHSNYSDTVEKYQKISDL